ncbi:MAG: sodium:solute symporter family protein [Actinotalea sp.]|nr:sodium:solute symporter family protein [Actinotalea sp.]
MSAAAAWTVGLALVWTAFLVVLGRRATPARGRDGYFVGGRSVPAWVLAASVTALFGGSSFIAISELAYRSGVPALWYSLAVVLQVLLIALVLVGPLHRRLVVTVSGLVGDRYGRAARGVSGLITGLTFPMWSVATAIAFASALHALLGLPIGVAVVLTALLLLAYVWAGGMRSLLLTQSANALAIGVMAAVGVAAVLHRPGPGALVDAATAPPPGTGGVGLPLVLAWFGTFVVNVLLAQATFQMAMACRSARSGRNGLLGAAALVLPLAVVGTALGVAAALVVPGERLGLVAVAQFVAGAVPAPLAGLFFLGIWACALGWGAPCQFSGATSLGRDVGRALRPGATEADVVRWTKVSLIGLTVLMVAFALLRTEQSAWWNVLAWTLRNGATLAPVVAALLWPLATRAAVLAALPAGFGSGLLWYHLGGWEPATFHHGVHPVWVGMTVNLVVLVVVTLLGPRPRLTAVPGRRRAAVAALAATFGGGGALAVTWPTLHPLGLTGPGLLGVVGVATAAAVLAFPDGRQESADQPSDRTAVTGADPAAEPAGIRLAASTSR